MDNWKMWRVLVIAGVAFFYSLGLVAQPFVKTSVSKNEILIGDQFNVRIETGFAPGKFNMMSPSIPDSLAHFEVVNRSKIDSVYQDQRLAGLVQTLTLTSFDSGKWVLPSFTVSLASGDSAIKLFTDSVPITVSFAAADSTNQLRDIKPIMEVETTGFRWYWLAIVLVLVIFLLGWWYIRRKKKEKPVTVRSSASAYEKAMTDIDQLKSYDLVVPADIRVAHVKLGSIIKEYLSHTQNNNFLTKTTGDILILLQDHLPGKEMLVQAAASLRCGDAVKFAKYLPPVKESEECMLHVKEIIQAVHRQGQPAKTQRPVKTEPLT